MSDKQPPSSLQAFGRLRRYDVSVSPTLMQPAFYAIAAVLVAGGLLCAVVPAAPGVPLVFGGIWLAAYLDGYRHIGVAVLLVIGLLGAVGMGLDLFSGALGAKRVGASGRAAWGALVGTVVGLFLGLPGLLLGPFLGAVAGELSARSSLERATQVGVNAWIGFLLGSIAKLVACLSMVALAVATWWWRSI